MRKIILKFSGLLAFVFIMLYNINIKDPNNTIGVINLNALSAAIAATCESDDGDVCKCKYKCTADETTCMCLNL